MKKEQSDLDFKIKQAIGIAKELNYSVDICRKIYLAKSESEITRIMINARKGKK